MTVGSFSIISGVPISIVFDFASGVSKISGPTVDPVFVFISVLVTLLALYLYMLRPNLVIIVKNKLAIGSPIYLFRARSFWSIFQNAASAAPAFSEIIPTLETEKAIRELGAIINDIQRLGENGYKSWLK